MLPALPLLASLQLQDNYSVGVEGVRALAAAIGAGGCPSLQVGWLDLGWVCTDVFVASVCEEVRESVGDWRLNLA